MKLEDYYELYWKQYLNIEDEFLKSLNYVSFSNDNLKSYSNAFIKLLLQIDSEVDICFQKLCKLAGDVSKPDKINLYYKSLKNHYVLPF